MKHFFTIIAFVVTVCLNAQAKPEKKAQKFTDEMTEVLSLNKEESKAIYEIQLQRFKENKAINEEFSENPEMKKEKLKALGNKVYNEVKNILGKKRQKQWKEYKTKTK